MKTIEIISGERSETFGVSHQIQFSVNDNHLTIGNSTFFPFCPGSVTDEEHKRYKTESETDAYEAYYAIRSFIYADKEEYNALTITVNDYKPKSEKVSVVSIIARGGEENPMADTEALGSDNVEIVAQSLGITASVRVKHDVKLNMDEVADLAEEMFKKACPGYYVESATILSSEECDEDEERESYFKFKAYKL